jgi:hypothetical protein
MESRRQWALELILDDSSLTDYLDDTEAERLLKWGLALARLFVVETAEMGEDEATEYLEPKLKSVRVLVRRINRLLGELTDLDPEEAVEQLERILDAAAQVPLLISSPPDDFGALVERLQGLPTGEALTELLFVLERGEIES